MKTPTKTLRLVLLLVCLGAFSATAAFAQGPPPGTVRVTADVLNVRVGPGPRFRIVNRVARGTLLKVIDVRDGWLHVRRPAGVLGWVYSGGTVRVK